MRTAATLLTRFMNMVGAGCGVRALDCVRMPRHLAYVPNARSQRMVRNAQVSAW